MPPITPYTADLDDREPIAAMRDTTARIRALVGGWRPDQFDRSYAPGKWDARQILTHLAQSEIALGYRARMALTTPGYAAQSFDQDAWMARGSRRTSRPRRARRVSRHRGDEHRAVRVAVRRRPRHHALPSRVRLADGRLDHPPDGRPPDSPSRSSSKRSRGGRAGTGRMGGTGRDRRRGKQKGREGFPSRPPAYRPTWPTRSEGPPRR